MENASKALIMAAEILIGVMIISVGMYLYNTFGSYSAETTQAIEQAQIDIFNQQFSKYYGFTVEYDEQKKQEVQKPIKCTIHDIVNLANLAKQNNTELGLDETENGYSNNTRYIQIDIDNEKNIEKKNESEITALIKGNDLIISGTTSEIKYFKCKELNISEITKYVNYMKFEVI